jgi:hypothetical protein
MLVGKSLSTGMNPKSRGNPHLSPFVSENQQMMVRGGEKRAREPGSQVRHASRGIRAPRRNAGHGQKKPATRENTFGSQTPLEIRPVVLG